jgi:hypothetical protein
VGGHIVAVEQAVFGKQKRRDRIRELTMYIRGVKNKESRHVDAKAPTTNAQSDRDTPYINSISDSDQKPMKI